MFYELFRKYNQNRKTIWAVIIMVAFFVIALHSIFAMIRSSKNKQLEELIGQANQQQTNSQTNQVENTNSNISSSNSITNNENTQNNNVISQTEKEKQSIQEFIEYCNNNQITQAYEMLTQDCKQILFPTISDFEQNYVKKVFTSEKSAKIEESMYSGRIYKVTYTSDLLSSGGYQQENIVQDYIRVEQEENENKLSLNKFLYLEEINKANNESSIEMKVIYKEVYIDFEIYQIQIINKSNQTILLSQKEENDSVYILDENQVKYPSNMDEQAIEKLVIESGKTVILNVKFNKMYNTERKIQGMKFSNIIMDYEKYQRGEEAEKKEIYIQF